jgi:hypothetical protein
MAELTAVGKVVAEAVEQPARAVQLPLLPVEVAAELPGGVELGAAIEARRRGRPPGSVNRATAEWRDWLLRRYRSPLEALAETYSRPVDVLAAELRCTLLEAMQLQQRAAIELAPYLHGKAAVEVNLTGRGLVGLTIVTGQAGDGAGGDLVIDGTLVENQGDDA